MSIITLSPPKMTYPCERRDELHSGDFAACDRPAQRAISLVTGATVNTINCCHHHANRLQDENGRGYVIVADVPLHDTVRRSWAAARGV